jgi:hypothetical protein
LGGESPLLPAFSRSTSRESLALKSVLQSLEGLHRVKKSPKKVSYYLCKTLDSIKSRLSPGGRAFLALIPLRFVVTVLVYRDYRTLNTLSFPCTPFEGTKNKESQSSIATRYRMGLSNGTSFKPQDPLGTLYKGIKNLTVFAQSATRTLVPVLKTVRASNPGHANLSNNGITHH